MENIKAKIQAILMNSSQKSVIGWAVEENDFEDVADEIVKNCFLPNVAEQSEQLPNMTLEQAIEKAKPNLDKIKDVDKHLDDIR